MKRALMKNFVLLLMTLLICTACTRSEPEEVVDMDALLQIHTKLLRADLEGTGHWSYIDQETRNAQSYYPKGDGYWIPDDGGAQLGYDEVFATETLQLGQVRTMAPMGGNLYIDIEYEGIVEVTKIDPVDNSIRLVNKTLGDWVEVDTIKANAPYTVMICPVGKNLASEGTKMLMTSDTLVDKEYLIQVQACTFDGAPIVTAQLKLTAIPDPAYPWETVHEGMYGELYQMGEVRTRFCSIELVSYTYNEMYLLNEE